MTDSAELTAFRSISARLGADCRHVQGPGGNTSIKLNSRTMLIKASGFELRHAESQDIFTEVDLPRIRESLRSGSADPLAGTFAEGARKPSIETTMHGVMRHRVVIHTHSLPVVALMCRKDASTVLSERVDHLPWVLVEYARPGTPLAHRLGEAVAAAGDPCVVFLQNHGVVVGGDTTEEAYGRLMDVVERLETTPRVPLDVPDLGRLAGLAHGLGLTLPRCPLVHELALHPESTAIAMHGSLYPDHVVFLGSKTGAVSARQSAGWRSTPISSKLWLIPGIGALLEPDLPAAAQDLARCLAEVVSRLPREEACVYLTAHDETDLLMMEEEVYRQELARRVQ